MNSIYVPAGGTQSGPSTVEPDVHRTLLVVLSLVAASPAAAQELRVVRIVDGVLAEGAAEARLGETSVLTVAELVRRGRARALRPLPAGARVRWLRIEPLLRHRDLAPPNEGVPLFSNSVLFGPEHGRWIGYDTIEVDTLPLAGPGVAVDGAVVRIDGVHPTDRARDVRAGAGTTFVAAEVTLPDGRVLRTPDATSVDRQGLTRDVMRVSFRTGDDYLGWLSSYFHVPFVFGSAGAPGRHQTDRYTGADCADVLVGALRASGRRDVRYTSVSGVDRYADSVGEVHALGRDGRVLDGDAAAAALRWGHDVRPGDLLAIDYTDDPDGDLPRAWDHIGVLVRDADADGLLGASDIVRHMGNDGLTDEPLSAQGSIRFRVWRWSR
jgi:hypothetical protein